jgi:CheY-specific phosphatase CheX
MNKSAMTDAMKASISEVLEQMFFMPIEFVAPDAARPDPEPGGAPLIARLGFSGPLAGVFLLQVPSPLAQSVSVDFLGAAQSDLSDDDVSGTVLEMVNMLAGGALSIYDSHALFDLQIPQLISKQDMGVLAGQDADGILIRIQTPESRMMFQLITRG